MKFFVIISLFALGMSEHNNGYYLPQPEQSFVPYVSSLHLQTGGGGSPYSNIEHSLEYNHQPQLPEQTHSQSETYNKEFYSFSAPEEGYEDLHALEKIQAAVQKNVRVIFIRAPENRAIEHAAFELAKSSADDKTAIYVLNKQADIGDLANRLSALRVHTHNKPEVHFVKYRTQEDAAHAQHSIQAQYDSRLPGQTQNFNEGVAPALNFVSNAAENSLSYGNNLGNYYGQTTDLNSFQNNLATPQVATSFQNNLVTPQVATSFQNNLVTPQVATSFSSGFGNFYGQTTDSDAFKINNFAIPQATSGLEVGGSISTPYFNAGFGGNFGQAVDLNAYKGQFPANAAFKSDGFKENLGYSTYENGLPNSNENPIARINSRLSAGSSSFVFPTEASSTNNYLPSYLPPTRQRKFK